MRRQTIGRNEACPCGSGKKYKKCCYGKKRKHQFLPSYDEIDYGSPILDDDFFAFNTVHEISAPRLLYSTLLMPKVEKEAEKIARQFIERGKEELKTIEGTTDVSELIKVMRQSSDSLNHVKLIDKLLGFKDESLHMLIDELKQPQQVDFIEIAIKVIHRSGNDYSNEILEIIKFHQRDAYAISQLCMLLGFYENKESEKLLWNYFYFFKQHFRHETYSDGPLLGLIEMREQRKENLFGHSMN